LEDRTHPNVLRRLRVPTEADKGYEHIIGQIAKLIETLAAETGLKPTSIGIATPGTLDPISGTMKNANTTCLNGRPFNIDLELALKIPVKLANDANCFAIAETKFGAVQDILPNAKVVFGVIMGTGVGGGLVVNGEVWNGRQGIAGEWGHNFLDNSGGKCYCGRVGCVETIFSGPGLERYYTKMTGEHVELKEIIRRARAYEDVAAEATMQRMIQFFGKGLSIIINTIDPDVIVLGGGLSHIDELYSDGIAEISKWVFNSRLDTLIVRPKLGDSAGVFGAALL
jgi:fructokinase